MRDCGWLLLRRDVVRDNSNHLIWTASFAIFAAGLVRPKMFDVGLLDNFIASMFEGQADQTPAGKPGQKVRMTFDAVPDLTNVQVQVITDIQKPRGHAPNGL
jgi:hypothetical protein